MRKCDEQVQEQEQWCKGTEVGESVLHSGWRLQWRRAGLRQQPAKIRLGTLEESMENHREILRKEVARSDVHVRRSSVTVVEDVEK